MLVFIITMLLVGYTEEALFRGLVQNAFHKIFGEQSWQAVWAACASFPALLPPHAVSPASISMAVSRIAVIFFIKKSS